MRQPEGVRWLEIQWQAETAFGSPFNGTQCFGQLCAQLASTQRAELVRLLQGYLQGQPFMVVGDPRPLGYLPRPTYPMHLFAPVDGLLPKQVKNMHWVRWDEDLQRRPVREWLGRCVSDSAVAADHGHVVAAGWQAILTHTRAFRPREGEVHAVEEWHYQREVRWAIDVVYDNRRISAERIETMFEELGARGYGAAATRGLGKFSVQGTRELDPPTPGGRDVRLALGACVPWSDQVQDTWYRSFVYQGRRGSPGDGFADWHQLVKAPVQLARAGAIVAQPHVPEGHGRSVRWLGSGIGGPGVLSPVDPHGVLQAYSPSLAVAGD